MVKRKLHVLNCAGKAEAILKQWKKLGEPLPGVLQEGRLLLRLSWSVQALACSAEEQ